MLVSMDLFLFEEDKPLFCKAISSLASLANSKDSALEFD